MDIGDLIRRQDALLIGYEGETVEFCRDKFKKKFEHIAEEIWSILRDMKMIPLQLDEMKQVFREEYEKRVDNLLVINRHLITSYRNGRDDVLSNISMTNKEEELSKEENRLAVNMGVFGIQENRPNGFDFNPERDTVFDPIITKCIESITEKASKANGFDENSARGEQIRMEVAAIIKKEVKEVTAEIVNELIERVMTVLHITNGQILEATSQNKEQVQESKTQVADVPTLSTENIFIDGGLKPVSYKEGLDNYKNSLSNDKTMSGEGLMEGNPFSTNDSSTVQTLTLEQIEERKRLLRQGNPFDMDAIADIPDIEDEPKGMGSR